ncbi:MULTISPECIES: glycoside hydrolase family 99-like domain-containing protein [unclassified Shinella]|uniref:glycoside hydrolase family 99-like domain-containing protein n=1 Tax=unclassified Shinella TaxID=2643062 RepID=UPI00234EB1B3|nr:MULTISPECIES: glycoside hydrolase family 99-like domain-containing protein [unclassified Shinella]MCO5153691.1 glycoside hydrolase family 99-like domain-containing protein [Shinella sp.]MDC7259948.1 glycoside hydrolase family 99-like domain-containing protein [Shinella sp. YE25]CAK7262016.1 putative Glycosyltransferase 2-like domain-containing protein [Shinella sp. WSC3-e]
MEKYATSNDIDAVRRSFLFDADWYLKEYPEVAIAGLDPADHYCNQGWRQGLAPSTYFIPKPHDSHNPLLYALRNQTLRNPTTILRMNGGLNPTYVPIAEPAFEIPGSLSSTHIGPAEVIRPSYPGQPIRFSGKIAVHLHLFHVDMIESFRRLLGNVPVPYDLYVSVPRASEVVTAEIGFEGLENVKRVIVANFPNIGRDLGPMIAGFGKHLLPYDLVYHMHSKRSDHTPEKSDWAAQLGHHLLASREHASALIDMFACDAKLGLVFPVYHPGIRKQIKWGANFENCKRLMTRMGVKIEETDLCPFPAGSFFIIRREVLLPLIAGDFSFSEFDPENGQVDGTLAHAIERTFALICRQLGYRAQQVRASQPFKLASIMMDPENYSSPVLERFRSDNMPNLRSDRAPAGLRLAVFSGGANAKPLPYEHLLTGAEYIFLLNNLRAAQSVYGHWTARAMTAGVGTSWIAKAIKEAKNIDIAIWISPNVSVVGDISGHIVKLLEQKGAVAAFRHPSVAHLQNEVERIDRRYPTVGLLRKVNQVADIQDQKLLDLDLVIFDLRHPKAGEVLNRWCEISEKLGNIEVGTELAFTLSASSLDSDLVALSANGLGLRADPQLRIFQHAHPYDDVMPRIAEVVHRKPQPLLSSEMRFNDATDTVLILQSTDAPDAVAQTLQRFYNVARSLDRLIIAIEAGLSVALEGVISRHLRRRPQDIVTDMPVTALRSEFVFLIATGTLITKGALHDLAKAALSDSAIMAFMPIMTKSALTSQSVWPDQVADDFRKAAGKSSFNDVILTMASACFPAMLRRDVATGLMADNSQNLKSVMQQRLGTIPGRIVPSALVYMLADFALPLMPAEIATYISATISGHKTVEPSIIPIAFYLPQFHPFTINDKLWGAGFSEWRNVVKGRPRFAGHHQPRLPGDLGYYDLRTKETLKAQGELAELYGVFGMAFYYYRFGDQRLMEQPTDVLLANSCIQLRFFYCWANEDWTRAWDGRSDDVNLKQDYSDQTISLIVADLIAACCDHRYIRVQGKPVFMIYQLNKLPDPALAIDQIRREMHEILGVEIYLGTTYNDEFKFEWEQLVDFIVQFPPHRTPRKSPRTLMTPAEIPDLKDPSKEDFFESYTSVREQSIAALDTFRKLQPGVCPDWDNSARRERRAHILYGASPAEFGRWVRLAAHASAAKYTRGDSSVPFLFVNAWNEWAEGAVLEPYENDARMNLLELAGNLPWRVC